VIFIDSNIPMYVIGSSHPRKLDALRLLEGAISQGERLVTDAEVLREILHRYSAIGRNEAIQPAFEVLLGVVDEVFPVELAAVQRAMERHGVGTIMSFDRGFDAYPAVQRLGA
jgi:predicted nucleic acid-binding protein